MKRADSRRPRQRVLSASGYKIRVESTHRVIESNVVRAYPDNKHLVEILMKYTSLSSEERTRKGIESRELAKKHYNWDNIAKFWESILDMQEKPKRSWDEPMISYEIPTTIPDNLTNQEFVRWIFADVLKEPRREFGVLAADMLRDLNYGVAMVNGKIKEVTRKNIYDNIAAMSRNKLQAELARANKITISNPDYIQIANRKHNE